ncbi:hypothetical protein [Legionella waltersii]|uniref:Uncharacterized protein n=1 Tax=Legionella waltersii TaxID=66969 RepID=A0A0W1AAU0_9GAMM|nr:hypothetical protein [Legionella waltersii]KTD78485.1 hypothetical protein Lwal_1920 [Legionella waltersii]SNV05822.1 Uncharacterised protein [Legionella waltersii]
MKDITIENRNDSLNLVSENLITAIRNVNATAFASALEEIAKIERLKSLNEALAMIEKQHRLSLFCNNDRYLETISRLFFEQNELLVVFFISLPNEIVFKALQTKDHTEETLLQKIVKQGDQELFLKIFDRLPIEQRALALKEVSDIFPPDWYIPLLQNASLPVSIEILDHLELKDQKIEHIKALLPHYKSIVINLIWYKAYTDQDPKFFKQALEIINENERWEMALSSHNFLNYLGKGSTHLLKAFIESFTIEMRVKVVNHMLINGLANSGPCEYSAVALFKGIPEDQRFDLMTVKNKHGDCYLHSAMSSGLSPSTETIQTTLGLLPKKRRWEALLVEDSSGKTVLQWLSKEPDYLKTGASMEKRYYKEKKREGLINVALEMLPPDQALLAKQFLYLNPHGFFNTGAKENSITTFKTTPRNLFN